MSGAGAKVLRWSRPYRDASESVSRHRQVRGLPPSACGGFVDVEVRPPTTSERMKPRPRRRHPTASHREKRKRFRHTKTQGSAAAKPVRMATLTSRRALWRGDERSDSQMNDRTPSQSLSPQIVGDDPAATGLDCTTPPGG